MPTNMQDLGMAVADVAEVVHGMTEDRTLTMSERKTC